MLRSVEFFKNRKAVSTTMPGMFNALYWHAQKISGLPCEWCGEGMDVVKEKIIVCQRSQH